MTRRDDLKEQPWRFNFFGLMRLFERSSPNKPRIGRNIVPKDAVIDVGQEPFLDFPSSNVTEYAPSSEGVDRLKVKFLGYFGPQGALPLSTTSEVLEWKFKKSDGFLRFSEIFSSRFYQLFFRAWGSSRRVAQFDRPTDDRFQDYVRAAGGIPIPPQEVRKSDPFDGLNRLYTAGLSGSRIKGPGALRRILRASLRVDIEIEEFVPSWMDLEDDDLSRLGMAGSSLGVDMKLGSRAQSVSDKIRINIRVRSLEEYKHFLPGGAGYRMLSDLATGFVGPLIDIEVAPTLPAGARPSSVVGKSGTLGHTSWIAPDTKKAPDDFVESAVFLIDPEHNEDARTVRAA